MREDVGLLGWRCEGSEGLVWVRNANGGGVGESFSGEIGDEFERE